MKLRTLAIIFAATLLTACNFSLAEDVTPPPNYVPPTPIPTLGSTYPAQAPDIENGKTIYAAKCSACHGPSGLGDGDQGKQLPVTVTGLALPQVGREAVPLDWFTVVTRGNIERFMPPFASLNDQERWDVVAYALTLHTTPEQIALGKSIYETRCAEAGNDLFSNQEGMARMSDSQLAAALRNACDGSTTSDDSLADDDLLAAAAYLRTLTFAAPSPTPEPATATATASVPPSDLTSSPTPAGTESPAASVTGTPVADGTQIATEVIASPTPEPVGGKVTGSVSGDETAGLTVTLRGYDHTSETSGPQEILTATAATDAAGNFVFEGVEMPASRIFLAEVEYQGVTYASEATIVEGDVTELVIPPFKLYKATTDFSSLAFEQVHIFVDITDNVAQVIGVYTFSNTGNQSIVIESTTGIPFLTMPPNAEKIGFDLTEDSAPLIAAEGGFAIQPSSTAYGIVAYYTVPYDKKAQVDQPFVLSASSVLVLVPKGVKLKTDQLTAGETQNFQGMDYQQFSGGPLESGDTLTLNLSGTPKTSGTSGTDSQQSLLIGIGALGLVLILAGVWMYFRDRNRPDEELESEDEEQDDYESEEEILDAIIALDDLHRSGRIPEESYQSRRDELKARLKG